MEEEEFQRPVGVVIRPPVVEIEDSEVEAEELDPNEDLADKENVQDNNEDDSETGNCPICLEPWTASGKHRLASLRCGHLFGRICIDRWLAGGESGSGNSGRAKCPQCNAPAKRADIRLLYCKRLVALDTSERDRLEALLCAERKERSRLEEALAQASLQSQLLRVELDSLKGDLQRFKKRRLAAESETGRAPLKFLRRCIVGSGSGYSCQRVCFDAHNSCFILIRNDSESGLFGVVKVSLWDATASEFVALHEDAIKACAASPHGDSLLATVACDGWVKLATMQSNSVVQKWRLPEGVAGWSIAFHPTQRNILILGLSGGRIGIIDLTKSEVSIVQVTGLRRAALPIHSIAITEDDFVVGGTMDGPFVLGWEDLERPCWSWDFGYGGVACSSIDIKGKFVLSSFRSLPPNSDQPSRHVIIELKASTEESSSSIIASDFRFWEFKSQSCHKKPFTSILLNPPQEEDGYDSHFQVFLPDESTSAGQCYLLPLGEVESAGCRQVMPCENYSTNAGTSIVDCCIAELSVEENEKRQVLALLTEKHLYLFSN